MSVFKTDLPMEDNLNSEHLFNYEQALIFLLCGVVVNMLILCLSRSGPVCIVVMLKVYFLKSNTF